MQIKFLGNWSSHIQAGKRNVSIIIDGHIVLDCGPHTIESMLENGIDPAKIDKMLISHMHLDHYGGLAEILWYRGARNVKDELTIMGPKGIRKNTEKILQIYNTPDNYMFSVKPNYVEINNNGEVYEIKTEFIDKSENDYIEAFSGNHIIPDNMYRLEYRGNTIAYTGDTAYNDNIPLLGENADILLHEMTYMDKDAEIAKFWKHSTYSSAIKGFGESHAKKLVPVHLTDETVSVLKAKYSENIILPFADINL